MYWQLSLTSVQQNLIWSRISEAKLTAAKARGQSQFLDKPRRSQFLDKSLVMRFVSIPTAADCRPFSRRWPSGRGRWLVTFRVHFASLTPGDILCACLSDVYRTEHGAFLSSPARPLVVHRYRVLAEPRQTVLRLYLFSFSCCHRHDSGFYSTSRNVGKAMLYDTGLHLTKNRSLILTRLYTALLRGTSSGQNHATGQVITENNRFIRPSHVETSAVVPRGRGAL